MASSSPLLQRPHFHIQAHSDATGVRTSTHLLRGRRSVQSSHLRGRSLLTAHVGALSAASDEHAVLSEVENREESLPASVPRPQVPASAVQLEDAVFLLHTVL